jgi:hypothetical protein
MNKLCPLGWSAVAAILAGFLLWMLNAVKPLWRSAAVVLVAAFAANYLAPCEACDKGTCEECVKPG